MKASAAHAERLAQYAAAIEDVIRRLTELQRPLQASILTLRRIQKMALPDAVLGEGIAEFRRIGNELRQRMRERPGAEMGERLLELEQRLRRLMEGVE
jgi:HPt (histidine-containing phosphotransfer) domain-containing protein